MTEPPQIDLEPEEYRAAGKPRMLKKREVSKLVWICLVLVAIGTWNTLANDAWWAPFVVWPPIFVLGAAVGYKAPHVFFSEDS